MLRLEIVSLELKLMKSIFYAQHGIRILAVHIGKFLSEFAKFKTFGMKEWNGMMLLQLQPSHTSQRFTIRIAEMPAVSSAQSPNYPTTSMNLSGY
jgi:hypothetical protein